MSRPNSFLTVRFSALRFSRGELCASLAIITLTALFFRVAFAAPLLAQTKEQTEQSSCASNLKQLELGFLMYSQDYDEKFPLVCQPLNKGSRVLSGWAVTHDRQGKAAVVPDTTGTSSMGTDSLYFHAPVFPYVKTSALFHCPSLPVSSSPVSYMMNDLMSGGRMAQVALPARTVLLCDGENFAGNAGHTYDPVHTPVAAKFSTNGAVLTGATLQMAPTRHRGGANYGFMDGHVKWFKPQNVFFPSRSSGLSHKEARTGRIVGPDPLHLSAKGFNATFHLQ